MDLPVIVRSQRRGQRSRQGKVVEPIALASSRVSRTRGVASSVCFEQPLRARLVMRTVQYFFITYGYFNPWVLISVAVILLERKSEKSWNNRFEEGNNF